MTSKRENIPEEAWIEVETEDHMRGSRRKIIVHYKPNDLVKLPCHCNYDEKLCNKSGNEVMLLRNVEIKGEDGSWKSYPRVAWQDGVLSENQLQTMALIAETGEEEISVMLSSDGVPDGKLYSAAQKAGICVETIDG